MLTLLLVTGCLVYFYNLFEFLKELIEEPKEFYYRPFRIIRSAIANFTIVYIFSYLLTTIIMLWS